MRHPRPSMPPVSAPAARALAAVALLAAAAVAVAPRPARAGGWPTVAVVSRAMPHELILTGNLVANQQAEVAANATGRVTRTFVERGSVVRRDAPLAQLDVAAAGISDAEARANLEVARSQAALATGQCERNRALFAKGAISKDEWDRISSGCRTSEGQARAAAARADLAAKALGDATVRAPFAGIVGERLVSVGEYVQPATKIVSLVEVRPLRLQLTVPEADVAAVAVGQAVHFAVQAHPDADFVGQVAYIAPAVRASTRDLVVEAKVDNADGRLRPGMFATARLRLAPRPVPVVPATALRRAQGGAGARVFVAANGRLVERLVQTGATVDGQVAVLDGLAAGETVVAHDAADLRDGAPTQ